jgi:hypothetical protein
MACGLACASVRSRIERADRISSAPKSVLGHGDHLGLLPGARERAADRSVIGQDTGLVPGPVPGGRTDLGPEEGSAP